MGPPPTLTPEELEQHLDALDRCPADVAVYDPVLAAAYLGMSENTLRVYRHAERWRHLEFPAPAITIGRSPRWTRLQLDTFQSTRRPAGWPRKETTTS